MCKLIDHCDLRVYDVCVCFVTFSGSAARRSHGMRKSIILDKPLELQLTESKTKKLEKQFQLVALFLVVVSSELSQDDHLSGKSDKCSLGF